MVSNPRTTFCIACHSEGNSGLIAICTCWEICIRLSKRISLFDCALYSWYHRHAHTQAYKHNYSQLYLQRKRTLRAISLPVGKHSWSPPTRLPFSYKLPLTGDWGTVGPQLLAQTQVLKPQAGSWQSGESACVRQSVTVCVSVFEQEPCPPDPF